MQDMRDPEAQCLPEKTGTKLFHTHALKAKLSDLSGGSV